MHAVTFGSAAEYLAYPKPDVPACLVLDVELPDINGLDLQGQLTQADQPQIVCITGHGDIPSSVRAIKSGAVDFLTKPFKEADLMRAINAALAQNRDARRKRAELADLRQRHSSLTPREREVLPLVASGLLNKQAAAELGISEITLQIHRGNIMDYPEGAKVLNISVDLGVHARRTELVQLHAGSQELGAISRIAGMHHGHVVGCERVREDRDLDVAPGQCLERFHARRTGDEVGRGDHDVALRRADAIHGL